MNMSRLTRILLHRHTENLGQEVVHHAFIKLTVHSATLSQSTHVNDRVEVADLVSQRMSTRAAALAGRTREAGGAGGGT